MATFTAILYPTAFPMIQVESSSLAHHFEGRRKSGHESSKGRSSHCKAISTSARSRLKKIWVSWDDRVLEPTENGIKRHCKEEAARRTALSDAPGQRKLSSAFSCKFNFCSADAVNHTQEPTCELWQLRLVKNVKDPGMVDAKICGSKVRL